MTVGTCDFLLQYNISAWTFNTIQSQKDKNNSESNENKEENTRLGNVV